MAEFDYMFLGNEDRIWVEYDEEKTGENWRFVYEWLIDPSRKGTYSFIQIPRGGRSYAFSHPDTAFEFKMRWV